METLLEKPETELEQKSVESQEQEISPEMRERFEDVLKDAITKHYMDFEDQASWGEIHKHWESWSLWKKMSIVEGRKSWIVMKQEGELFNKFITDKIRTYLESGSEGLGYSEYKLLHIYAGLNGTVDYKIYAEMLGHKTVWGDNDGSSMHELLQLIGESKDEAAVGSVINYINHVVSPEYKRKQWLEADLGNASRTLVALVGKDQAVALLEELAEKDSTLSGWLHEKIGRAHV